MLPAPHVTLSMSEKRLPAFLGRHYGWYLWKNEDLLADLVEFFCPGSAVQRSLWARLERRDPVSEAEKTRRRTEAANAVTHTPVDGGLGPAPEDSKKKVLLRALCM